jgi:hypothetical protein
VANTKLRSLYLWEGVSVLIGEEGGWGPGPLWTGMEKRNVLPPQRFEPWIVKPVASHYTDSEILAGIDMIFIYCNWVSTWWQWLINSVSLESSGRIFTVNKKIKFYAFLKNW